MAAMTRPIQWLLMKRGQPLEKEYVATGETAAAGPPALAGDGSGEGTAAEQLL